MMIRFNVFPGQASINNSVSFILDSVVPGMIGPMGLPMPHSLMPNVPIGVPPPNMQSLLGPPGMMQTMLTPPVNSPFGAGVGVGLLTQIPLPAPAAPSDKPNSTGTCERTP